MNKLRVYIAGPYTSSGDVFDNIHHAMELGRRMVTDGLAPFVPHLDSFMYPGPKHLDYETALSWDLAWVAVSDCVFRIAGESVGADRETDLARELGIPVFKDYYSLLRFNRERGGE